MIELAHTTSSPHPIEDSPIARIHTASTPDQELVRHYLAGDVAAFEILVTRYQDRIFNFCLRYTANPADAEEIAQETFLKAYKGLARFRGDSKFSTWLFQISKNLCINKFHKKQRRKENKHLSIHETDYESDRPVLQLESDAPSPLDMAEATELNDHLQDAIAELDAHYRAALVLRDVEDLDYSEIAEILDVPVGTVKSRIHRARTELQKKLAHLLEDVA